MDPAVERKLRYSFEQHDTKITSAFLPWVLMLDPKDMRDRLNYMVQLMISLKRGREPSMYVDFGASDNAPQEPTVAVTAVNATDCIRLAETCWTAAMAHMTVRTPTTASKAQDQFFALSKSSLGSLFNDEDFWWYFIHRMERGETDIAKTVVSYLSEYKGKHKKSRTDPSP